MIEGIALLEKLKTIVEQIDKNTDQIVEVTSLRIDNLLNGIVGTNKKIECLE